MNSAEESTRAERPLVSDTAVRGASDDELQAAFTLLIREYVSRFEGTPSARRPILDSGGVTASDVGTCCMAMLEDANMELFELTLWGSRIPAAMRTDLQ